MVIPDAWLLVLHFSIWRRLIVLDCATSVLTSLDISGRPLLELMVVSHTPMLVILEACESGGYPTLVAEECPRLQELEQGLLSSIVDHRLLKRGGSVMGLEG